MRIPSDLSGLFGGPASTIRAGNSAFSADTLLQLRPIRARAVRALSRLLIGPSFVAAMGERLALKELFR